MKTDGPKWTQALTVTRHTARTLSRTDIPRAPGVYLWFRDGQPVYAGRAKGAGGLRERLAAHLAHTTDLSRSTFRATVATVTLGIDRKHARSRPSVLSAEQVLVTAAVGADVPAELAGHRYRVAAGDVTADE